ncbi:hypothetical protein CEXT_325291 [Caerostris extrusa]|uniref:Uncharacterized protein n=1 Tax=Caerostris extrusa TaxID=172846 RepID=A0AAV4XDP4_CAEEX|nr:hypothetical protein CEXT_325291 [Caerostris extrusa]
MDLESRVLELIVQNPNGVNNKMLQSANPSTGVAELVEVINKLTAVESTTSLPSPQFLHFLTFSCEIKCDPTHIGQRLGRG